MIVTMIFPFDLNHLSLKSEYIPLKKVSENSKLADISIIRRHLLKNDIAK